MFLACGAWLCFESLYFICTFPRSTAPPPHGFLAHKEPLLPTPRNTVGLLGEAFSTVWGPTGMHLLATDESSVELYDTVQGNFAHKKTRPPPRITIRPYAYAYCRILEGGVILWARYPCKSDLGPLYTKSAPKYGSAVKFLGLGTTHYNIGCCHPLTTPDHP